MTSNKRQMRVVTVIYKSLPKYRIPFFSALRQSLAEEGIRFRLIYGQPPPNEAMLKDTGDLSWGCPVHNYIVNIGSKFICWQRCLYLVKDSNLIILEQASKMINNYILIPRQLVGGPKIALWGHGRNFKRHSASFLGEAIKKILSRHVHWWFVYNESSAEVVRKLGFPSERITIVQNSIDTTSLRRRKVEITTQHLLNLRKKLNIDGRNIGIYIGGLYKEKRIDFLLETALEIRKLVDDFELLIVGAGPEQGIVEEASQKSQWIRYLGPRFGDDKVSLGSLSKVMLMPGAIGLGVIDSFALEVPLVTMDLPYHGPEIEYLVNNENGIIMNAGSTPRDYGEYVALLLRDNRTVNRLKEGCRAAAERYTIEEMVRRFTEGVLKALKT